MRLEQLRQEPAAERWLVRAMVLRDDPARAMIGHVGFHGPPQDGAAEMGYTVFARYRGHGYATEAVTGMMGWARSQGVQRFILSIAPGNAPSLAVARRLGFKRIGRQMDEVDGLEYVFELKAP
jgi:RimJ/RimL family protein N-acetyltransferase